MWLTVVFGNRIQYVLTTCMCVVVRYVASWCAVVKRLVTRNVGCRLCGGHVCGSHLCHSQMFSKHPGHKQKYYDRVYPAKVDSQAGLLAYNYLELNVFSNGPLR